MYRGDEAVSRIAVLAWAKSANGLFMSIRSRISGSKNLSVQTCVTCMIEAVYFFKTDKQKVCEILSREHAPLNHLRGDDEVE